MYDSDYVESTENENCETNENSSFDASLSDNEPQDNTSHNDMSLGVDISYQKSWNSEEDDFESSQIVPWLNQEVPETSLFSKSMITPTGLYIGSGFRSGRVAVWDAESKTCVWSKPDAHFGEVWQVLFLNDISMVYNSNLDIIQNSKVLESGWTSSSFQTSISPLLVSGSDDCSFKLWDLRQKPNKPAIQNTRHYQMGVTCFASNYSNSSFSASHIIPTIESSFESSNTHDNHYIHRTHSRSISPFELFIGSYDETLSLWDIRTIKSPIHSTSLGGGVWRLRLALGSDSQSGTEKHNSNNLLIAAALMHNGFEVLEYNSDNTENPFLSKTKYWGPHKGDPKLAYGIDWIFPKSLYSQPQTSNSDSNIYFPLVGSCTFYDNQLSIWKY